MGTTTEKLQKMGGGVVLAWMNSGRVHEGECIWADLSER